MIRRRRRRNGNKIPTAGGYSPAIMPLDDFLSRWRHADGSELTNHQLFVTDLCAHRMKESRFGSSD